MQEKEIDLTIFLNAGFEPNPNMFYFSGYSGAGLLAIPKKQQAFLMVPEMEASKAKRLNFKIIEKPKGKRFFQILKQHSKAKTIGLETENFSILALKELRKQFKRIKIKDISKACYDIRKVKCADEVKIIKQGCKITDEIMLDCFKNFKKFKTESEVKAYLEYNAKKKGCDLAFPTIVASGKNSALAHHQTEDKRLTKGFCIIDFGVKYKGYCTDITRTIYLGKPKKQEIELYNILLGCQNSTIKQVKIGARCADLFIHAQKQLGKYAKYFNHGLGHGIGAQIHESPNLYTESKDVLVKDMTFTIEPGIYLKDSGIRIEDDILVTDKGYEILTKTEKGLITI